HGRPVAVRCDRIGILTRRRPPAVDPPGGEKSRGRWLSDPSRPGQADSGGEPARSHRSAGRAGPEGVRAAQITPANPADTGIAETAAGDQAASWRDQGAPSLAGITRGIRLDLTGSRNPRALTT